MTQILRPRPGGALAAILLASVAAGCRNSDVVAEVGSHKIRRAELDQFARTQAARPEAALDALVERALLAEGARKNGLADDPQIRARLAAAEREVLGQAMTDRAMGTATDDAALRARYEAEKSRLARRRIHVAHLFVRSAGQDDRAAREKIDRLRARGLSGMSFEDLVRQGSEDPATIARGGDLGPLEEGQVEAAFFEAAARLKKGELSEPVRTAGGLHVIKALEDPRSEVPAFEKARPQLAAEAAREAREKLVAQLRSSLSVRTHPDRIAQGGGR